MKTANFFKLLTLVLLLSACGSRYRYNMYDLQELKDRNNREISSNWDRVPQFDPSNPYASLRPFSYNGELLNEQMYRDDPAWSKFGFSPYVNNAKIYKNYYEGRKDSWRTIWGLLN